MLKKTGVVLAIATAGLLATSPLAFAGASEHHHDGEGHNSSRHFDRDQVNSVDNSQVGLVNVGDVNSNVQTQDCGNGAVNTATATATATSAVTDLLAPVDPILVALLPQGTDISASGALAEADNSTVVTCSQTGGAQGSISQSNND